MKHAVRYGPFEVRSVLNHAVITGIDELCAGPCKHRRWWQIWRWFR